MAQFVLDSFTDGSGVALASHTGETGATWTEHPVFTSGAMVISNANRARAATIPTCYYASGSPAGADYDVTADFDCISAGASERFGIAARMDTTADTMYVVRYNRGTAAWEFLKVVAGSSTTLDSWSDTPTAGQSRAVVFHVRDAGHTVDIDGVQRLASADNAITAAGKVGIRASSGNATNSTLMHLDSISADDVVAPTGYLQIDQQPTETQENTVIQPDIEVSFRLEADDSIDTSFTGAVTVAFGANPGSSTLGGDTSVDAVAGVATFSDLTVSNPGSGYTLVFSTATADDVESDSFDITATPATKFLFITQPSEVNIGDIISPAIVVHAVNPDNATDTTWVGDGTIALNDNPGGATLSGTTTVTAVAGVLTYDDLSLDVAGDGYTLIVTEA